jgi:predicted O-methyltransferase YrrM
MFIFRYSQAVAACLYLFTLGVLKSRHRALIDDILTHFGLGRKPVAAPTAPLPRLPSIAIEDLIPDEMPISLSEMDAHDGNVTLLELVCIVKLARHGAPQACFEIGTFDGRSTLNIARNLPPNAKIHTLDLPRAALHNTRMHIDAREEKYVDKASSGVRFSGLGSCNNIVQLYGDSASFDFSPYEDKMEFVFVDGSHIANYVRNDAEVALRLLRGGNGIILFHDYASEHWPDVTTVLDALHETNPRFRALKRIDGTSLACLIVGPSLATA